MQTQATPSFAIFDDYRPIVGVAVVVRWVLLLTYIALLQYRIDRDTSWVVLNLMGGKPGGNKWVCDLADSLAQTHYLALRPGLGPR